MTENTEHEGPAPKVGLRDAPKRATAAQQLSGLQEQYEARGKPSAEQVQPEHNETHPKLKKLLEKRRSMVDVSISTCYRTPRRQPARKPPLRRRYKTIKRVKKKRGGLCEKCLQKASVKKALKMELANLSIDGKLAKKASKASHASKKRSDISIKTLTSERPSVSSYNSYTSMDHEPML